jgi:WD40 repeat protein
MRRKDPLNPGEIRRFEGLTGKVRCVAFSPDGKLVLSGSEEGLRLWDAGSGQVVRVLSWGGDQLQYVGATQQARPTWDSVRGVAFSADGQRALSGNEDATMSLWDVATGRELKRFHGYNREINSVAFSPDGRLALSGGYCYYPSVGQPLPPNLRLWDLEEGREVYGLSEHMMVLSVAFSPDGSLILSSGDDKSPRLAEARDGGEVRRFTGHTARGCVCVFFPDGQRILSGGWDQTLRVWDVTTGRQVVCIGAHSSAVTCVAVSPDGRRALSGSKDKSVRYWDLDGQRELCCLRGHKGRVTGVAISPDGRTGLSCGWEKTIRQWQLPA